MAVHFRSDHGLIGRGFQATYTSNEPAGLPRSSFVPICLFVFLERKIKYINIRVFSHKYGKKTLKRCQRAMKRSTQPRTPPWSLNRVPALIGWGKKRTVTSAEWQVTLCDPIWYVSSGSGEDNIRCKLQHSRLLYFCFRPHRQNTFQNNGVNNAK